jgi:hypothetical protein
MPVEVAGAMFEIEHRARLVVGELFEEDGCLIVFIQDAAMQVARKPWIETGEGLSYSAANASCFFRVGLGESFETFAKASRIFVSDGEDSDAALRAAGLAGEVVATAAHRVGERGVNNLY